MVKKEPVFEVECCEYESFYTRSNRPGRGWRGSRGSFRETFRGNYRGNGATGRKEPIRGTRSNGTRSKEVMVQEVKKEW